MSSCFRLCVGLHLKEHVVASAPYIFSLSLALRVVGGLLSSYDLSGDKIFLDKAKDIADRLLPAWDTPSGIPYNFINLRHGNAHNPTWAGVSPTCSKLMWPIIKV